MDKALLLTPFEALSVSAAPRGYSALIIGSEFCCNQVPTARQLTALAARTPGVKLWLATSILTDKALTRWEKLFTALPAGTISGVVFNDWGILPALAGKHNLAVSAGRLIMREFLRIEIKWTRSFMKEHGITSAEVDSPALAAAAAGLGLTLSLHRPMVFTAVTTFCPFEKHFEPVCSHSCGGQLVELRNGHLAGPLLMAEKAYFSRAPKAAMPPALREVTTLNFLPGRR